MGDKLTEAVALAQRYAEQALAMDVCPLHIVIDDLNVETHHVEWCRNEAQRIGDEDGVRLAEVLLTLTEDERREVCARRHGPRPRSSVLWQPGWRWP